MSTQISSRRFVRSSCVVGGPAVEHAPDELQRAIPTAEQVAIKFPDGTPRALGELDEWYAVTARCDGAFNGASGWALDVVHTIAELPSRLTRRFVRLGPWREEDDFRRIQAHRVRLGDGTYDYRLVGRPARDGDDDLPFEPIIDGRTDPARRRQAARSCSNATPRARLDPVTSVTSRPRRRHVRFALRHLDLQDRDADDQGAPIELDYVYDGAAEARAPCSFASPPMPAAPPRADHRAALALDRLWRRPPDARLAGGDVGAQGAVAAECWKR